MQMNTNLNAANVSVEKIGADKVRWTKSDGLELNIVFSSGFNAMGLAQSTNIDSVWADLSYEASSSTPKGAVAEGTLWFDADLKIEVR